MPILKAIYLKLLKLKAKQKYKLFAANATLGSDVTIGSHAAIIKDAQSRITIGNHCDICCSLTAKRGGSITIGDYTTIRGGNVGAKTKMTIGNHVIISNSVFIMDNNNHPTSEIKRHAMSESGFYSPLWEWDDADCAPITIEDHVWIGQGVAILKGVTIGRGSVIGINSVVTKSIPPHSIAVGNPAKVVKTIDPTQRI